MIYYILFKGWVYSSNIFFKFLKFQPRYSYKIYSHKKKKQPAIILWERKTIKRATKPDNDRKEGKKKEREKEERIEIRTKKNHKQILSSLQILAYARASKTKMKLNQVEKNWLVGNVFLRS